MTIYAMLKTTLVVPCYNEAQRFPLATFETFLTDQPHVSMVLVNDGSRDGTLAVLDKLRGEHPDRVYVIDRKINRGKAESVREGLNHALALQDCGEIIGFWDADLATPLNALYDMLRVFEDRRERRPDVQMVFGARVNLLGREIRRQPLRHYLGRIFATAVSVMLGLPIYDTQCGAKLFRVGPQTPELFREPFITRWVFDVEIIARWIGLNKFDREKVKASIFEYPLHRWEDIGGSKVKPYDFILAFRDVLRIYRRYF
jgi:glycosyltransferase involved in cell wall biosynthesis